MSALGIWVWVRCTWRNIHKRKFGDSPCPLDDCSNVHLKLAFVWKVTVGKVEYDLISLRDTLVAKLKLPTETQRKLAVHCLRCVQNEGFNYFDAHHGTNGSVTCVRNSMVKHQRCEWNNVIVFDTQDPRVLRRHYRNKCHVCRETQTLNVDILTKHPLRNSSWVQDKGISSMREQK